MGAERPTPGRPSWPHRPAPATRRSVAVFNLPYDVDESGNIQRDSRNIRRDSGNMRRDLGNIRRDSGNMLGKYILWVSDIMAGGQLWS
jgi:hypothetical protein